MTGRSLALLLSLTAVGCAGPAQNAGKGASPSLIAYVQALPQGADVAKLLAPDDPLQSGDRFAPGVHLADTRAGYAYALLRSAGGPPQQIYPAANAPAQLLPGKDTLLLSGADFFHLDDHPGKEVIYVVFAREPLGAAEALAAISASDQAAGKSRDEPTNLGERQRGRVQVALEPHRPTVIRFPFVHQ